MPLTMKKAATKATTTSKAKVKKVAPVEKKTVNVLAQKGTVSGYETIVDRLVDLEETITQEVLKAMKEQKRLEDELRAVADKEVPADAKATFIGTKYNFAVTERTEQRKVEDVREAYKQMGDKLFFDVAKVNLGDIDKYLTDAQKGFITTARTGPRKGGLVAK
jgi:hypothetical protein